MFQNAISFNQDISNWNISNVSDISDMFHDATNFNQPLKSWNVNKVTGIGRMFQNAKSFNQDISSWRPNLTYGPTGPPDVWNFMCNAPIFNEPLFWPKTSPNVFTKGFMTCS